MRILQNGFVIQFHSNKSVSCNINSKRKNEIIAYGQKMLLEIKFITMTNMKKKTITSPLHLLQV